jgi:phosphoglycolate phosphatase
MIDPDGVNLIIFDTDGTILSTTRPVYEAIKKAFIRLKWPVTFSGSDIERFFGMTADELYKYITPHGQSWEQARDTIRAEYNNSFREYAQTYPGVRETLELLRKRGYILALYSNASPSYFCTVVSTLEIKGYFDYTECIGENRLTKQELVGKIKRRFGNPVTAIVGDRHHDIEAAHETGSLSVGVQYGYGNEEPESADVTIAKFSDLLAIFDRKLAVFGIILNRIIERKNTGRPFVIGVNGVDCSGKTIFTEAMGRFLISKGYKVQIINLDDFHNPRHIRNAGEDPIESYYNRGFDYQTLIKSLLAPALEKKAYSISLRLLDLHTDRYEIEKTFSFTEDTIVLLEGVYLFRKELAPYIDYKVFLDIPMKESRRRAALRDVPVFGEEILRGYDEKYLPVQTGYLDEYPPIDVADMIIDNNNWEYPVIKYTRQSE